MTAVTACMTASDSLPGLRVAGHLGQQPRQQPQSGAVRLHHRALLDQVGEDLEYLGKRQHHEGEDQDRRI